MGAADVTTDLRRAESLLELGRPADAIALLGRVVAVEPDNVRALCLLAQSYNAVKDYRAMLTAADAATAADPGSEWAHRLRSMAFRNLGRHREALESARIAVRIAPQTWRPQINLAEALMVDRSPEAKRGAYDAAARALELAPHLASTHVTMGRVLLSIGEHDYARSYFESALALEPENAAAHTNLAVSHLRRGRLSKAGRGFGAVAAAHPAEALYANNVSATAYSWAQRVIDAGIVLVIVQLVVALTLPSPARTVIGVATTAGYAAAIAIFYRRLPVAMGQLVLRGRNSSLTQLNWLAFAIVVGWMLWLSITELTGHRPHVQLAAMPIWIVGIAARLRYRFGPRLAWLRQRRKYRYRVLGSTGRPMAYVPSQRSAQR
jgi:tetratricopeptide (TPR) repeat protein